VLPEGATPESADHVAERIRATLTAPILLDEASVRVGASVGVATWPEDGSGNARPGDRLPALLSTADRRMFAAKHAAGRRGREAAVCTGGRGEWSCQLRCAPLESYRRHAVNDRGRDRNSPGEPLDLVAISPAGMQYRGCSLPEEWGSPSPGPRADADGCAAMAARQQRGS
jgi:hypothetical protein